MLQIKKRNIVSAMLALTMMLSISVTALASTVNVTRVRQAKSNWCWAATSEMVGRSVNRSSTMTQWDVVGYVKGSNYPNVGGTSEDMKKGIAYASANTVSYTFGRTLSWDDHKSNIESGYPIAVWVDWYGGGAHALACAGTQTISGNNYLYIIDPWENNASTWYKYDALKNGTRIQSGVGQYDYSFWKR